MAYTRIFFYHVAIKVCNLLSLSFTDKPGKPVNFAFEDIRNTSVVCKWDPPVDNGGSEILNYIVEKKDATKDDTGWVNISSAVKGCSVPVTNLIEGKEYIFRVTGENKFGPGPPCYSAKLLAKNEFGKEL